MLWNYGYDLLASVEALATVIIIVVLGACVIALLQGRWPDYGPRDATSAPCSSRATHH
jgi:hypothetical protein